MWTNYWGTVSSGKSLKLLSSYLDKKRKHPEETVLLKPGFDSRTSGVFTRFGSVEVTPDLILNEENRLAWLKLLENKTYFFIDECQFLDERTINHLATYNLEDNKYFETYGLRNNFQGEMWESTKRIFNLCDSLVEIPTDCEICKKRKASWNKNLKKDATEDEPGFHYIPVCAKCFND
jgi:thymidine kinase